jgi:hypothetical protein
MAARGPSRVARPKRLGSVLAATTLLVSLSAAGCAGMSDGAEPELLSDDAVETLQPSDDPLRQADASLADDDTDALGEPEPLITASPDEHSGVGELVDGFPTDLLPLPDDAEVLVTSAVPVGGADVKEVSLNVRTAAGAQEILELYRAALVGAGFTEVPPTTTQTTLAAEAVFTRSGGDELISVGVLDVDGARTLTVGGRVRTAP